MFKTLAILAVMFCTQEVQAQYSYGGFGYRHSSTAAEGWYRGRGAYFRGQGEYLRSRAEATMMYEQARQQRIQNWRLYVETRQSLKDQYTARRKAYWADKRVKRDAYLAKRK